MIFLLLTLGIVDLVVEVGIIIALKLSFDSCLIYKELSLRRTVEFQPTRYIRRIGNQQLNVEMKVRNFIKVFLQHLAIT